MTISFRANFKTVLGVYLNLSDTNILKIIDVEKDEIVTGILIHEEEYYGHQRKYFGSISYTVLIEDIGLVDIHSNKFTKL